jgi:hypothetical protein
LPRTSVIITSCNYAEYLAAAIASVLAQTDGDFELLIVDDGSTDGSLEVARSYSDARIRVLVRPHGGPGAARNTGLEAAGGRYIAFLDADDVWACDKLAAECELLDRSPDVGCVYTRVGVIDAEGRVQSSGRSYLTAKPSGQILRQLLEGNVIGTPSSICFRRDLVEREGLWFDGAGTYRDDWHFYLRLAPFTHIRYLPRTLAYHRQHTRNVQGNVPTTRLQSLRTTECGLELARKHLELSEREIRGIERRVLAYVEAIAGREYVKIGNLTLARAHARRSLMHNPWNLKETVVFVLVSMGWMPRAIARRLK